MPSIAANEIAIKAEFSLRKQLNFEDLTAGVMQATEAFDAPGMIASFFTFWGILCCQISLF